jgi:hypothetical protein
MLHIIQLISFVYPGPKGSEEPNTACGGARRSQNQLAPPGDGGKTIDFQAKLKLLLHIPDTHFVY